MSSNKFYVYTYTDPLNNEVFYVGKGRGNRMFRHIHEAKHTFISSHKLNRIRKILNMGLEPIVTKIFETNNDEAAYAYEIDMIKFYGRRDLNQGTLLNLTDGGDGVRNRIFSYEERKNISNRTSGKRNYMYNRTHSNESRRKISISRIGKKRLQSYAERVCRRHYNPGGISTRKAVHKISIEGIILETFESLTAAGKSIGLGKGNISIKDGSCPTRGFFWRYTDSIELKEGFINREQILYNYKRNISGIRNVRKVGKYDENKNLVKVYLSIADAVNDNNAKYSLLYLRLREEKMYLNFYWRYIE